MKKNFTESLDSRLLKYSIAASTIILAATKTDAQVSVRAINTTLTGNSNYTISFNGLTNSFKIKHRSNLHTGTFTTGSSMPAYNAEYASIKASSASGNWVGRDSHHPKALSSGNLINGSNANARVNSYTVFTNYRFGGGSANGFKSSTKYIGVKFKLSDGIHYGWIRLVTSSNADSVKIDSIAYDTTPNQAIYAGSLTPLPVELTTFTAHNTGDKVELQWHTATEVNNYGFVIERASSSTMSRQDWRKIGFVKGSGNSNSPKKYSFIDDNPPSGTVEYRLKQIDNNGNFKYSKIVTVTSLPTKFELWQNYPNPFNPTTIIQYAIPEAEHVTLKVYDELGNEVTTLVNENKEAGQYRVNFNGSNLASGIYYYRIAAGDFTEVKKLMLLK